MRVADLGLLLLPLFTLMIIESRRLAIRFVWVDIVLGLLVAITVTAITLWTPVR
jgi:uncharacterized protein DUF2834